MATKSVATKKQDDVASWTRNDLWTRGGEVLTVAFPRDSGFPADSRTLDNLHEVIIGLAKAAVSIADQLQDGTSDLRETWHAGVALNGIADAIVLHATLAQGVSAELAREPSPLAQGGAA